MESDVSEENEKETSMSDSDWDNRKLCSDGNCIGVIGEDGHCNECGKKYQGPLTEEIAVEEEDLPPENISVERESSPQEEEAASKADESNDEAEFPTDSDWDNRKLCSDGNCIGVIGPDGSCKECGKSYED